MNLFDVYDAAFDPACEFAEDTIEYIESYAENALNVTLTQAESEKILRVRSEWMRCKGKNQDDSNQFFWMVEYPLKQESIFCLQK